MKILFTLIAYAFIGFGLLAGTFASGSPHEIEALILVLIGIIILCTVAILYSLQDIQSIITKKTDETLEPRT